MTWNRGDTGKARAHDTGRWNKVKITKAMGFEVCNGYKCPNWIEKGQLHGAGRLFYHHFCLECVKLLDFKEK